MLLTEFLIIKRNLMLSANKHSKFGILESKKSHAVS